MLERLPWKNAPLVLRVLLFLICCEFIRSGFLMGLLPQNNVQKLASIGFLVSMHYLVDALGKAPMGVLAERFGVGKIFVFLGTFGLLAVAFLQHSPYILALSLVILWGLGVAALWPSVMTLASLEAKSGQDNKALNWVSLATAPASGLGTFGIGQLARSNPTLAYDLVLGVAVVGFVFALTLWNIRIPKVNKPSLQPYRWQNLALLIPAAFIQTVIPSMVSTILFPFLNKQSLDLPQLAVLGSVAGVLGFLCLNFAGKSKIHPRRFILIGLLFQMIGMLLMSFLPLLNWGVLASIGVCFGIGFGFFMSGWNGLVVRTLPEQHRAAAWGILMSVEAAGYACGPSLGGWSWETWGMYAPFQVAAGLLLIVQIYYAVQSEKGKA